MSEPMDERRERIHKATGIMTERVDFVLNEFDLTVAEVVGILEVIKYHHLEESFRRGGEDE